MLRENPSPPVLLHDVLEKRLWNLGCYTGAPSLDGRHAHQFSGAPLGVFFDAIATILEIFINALGGSPIGPVGMRVAPRGAL
jgi:hypothetical protein